jgi:CheY-like chemotaxis protein
MSEAPLELRKFTQIGYNINQMKILAGKNVLVVDDEEALREILRDELENLGALVVEAENGLVALEKLKSQQFDAIVSDIRMPKCDGVELLDRVRGLYPTLPIMLFVTGFSDLSIEDAYNKGAAALFSKPFDVNAIAQSIQRLCTDQSTRWTRSTPRIEVAVRIQIKVPGIAQAIEAHLINIGQGGMFVRLEQDIPSVTKVIDFLIQGSSEGFPNKLEGQAVIRWNRTALGPKGEPMGFGAEFTNLSTETSEFVIEYLAKNHPIAYIPKK